MTEQTERSFVRWSLITFLAILSTVTVFIGSVTYKVIKETPDRIDKDVDLVRQDIAVYMGALRQDLNTHAQVLEYSANGQITATREEALARIDEATTLLNNQLNAVRTETLARIDNLTHTTNVAVASAIPVLNNSAQILETSQALVSKVNDQENMIYSRYLALTGEGMKTLDATRLTMNDVAEAAPKVSQSVVEIADDASRITGAAADYLAPKTPPKKQPFYLRWLPTIVVTAGKILF